MGKLTDEEFRDFLKTCRELAEGPFEEMQREVEVTNKFPQEFIDLARENNLYRYALPEQYGGWGFTEKEILQVQVLRTMLAGKDTWKCGAAFSEEEV